jgi:hypothetical protein
MEIWNNELFQMGFQVHSNLYLYNFPKCSNVNFPFAQFSWSVFHQKILQIY